jgi:Family of unknown function (DUF5946)
MAEEDAAYHELSAYTIGLRDAAYVHQHVVDAYAVQTASSGERPIRVAQALVGLYLHVEHGLTGRQVQRVHKILGDRRPDWPDFALPPTRGSMTVRDVLAQPPGDRRDRAIETWVRSTWEACRDLRDDVERFLRSNGITPSAHAHRNGTS